MTEMHSSSTLHSPASMPFQMPPALALGLSPTGSNGSLTPGGGGKKPHRDSHYRKEWSWLEKRDKKNEIALAKKMAHELDSCTFAPEINPASKAMMARRRRSTHSPTRSSAVKMAATAAAAAELVKQSSSKPRVPWRGPSPKAPIPPAPPVRTPSSDSLLSPMNMLAKHYDAMFGGIEPSKKGRGRTRAVVSSGYGQSPRGRSVESRRTPNSRRTRKTASLPRKGSNSKQTGSAPAGSDVSGMETPRPESKVPTPAAAPSPAHAQPLPPAGARPPNALVAKSKSAPGSATGPTPPPAPASGKSTPKPPAPPSSYASKPRSPMAPSFTPARAPPRTYAEIQSQSSLRGSGAHPSPPSEPIEPKADGHSAMEPAHESTSPTGSNPRLRPASSPSPTVESGSRPVSAAPSPDKPTDSPPRHPLGPGDLSRVKGLTDKLLEVERERAELVIANAASQRDVAQLRRLLETHGITAPAAASHSDSYSAVLRSLNQESAALQAALVEASAETGKLRAELTHTKSLLSEAEAKIAKLTDERQNFLTQLDRENGQLRHLFEDARNAKEKLVVEMNALAVEREQLANGRAELEAARQQLEAERAAFTSNSARSRSYSAADAFPSPPSVLSAMGHMSTPPHHPSAMPRADSFPLQASGHMPPASDTVLVGSVLGTAGSSPAPPTAPPSAPPSAFTTAPEMSPPLPPGGATSGASPAVSALELVAASSTYDSTATGQAADASLTPASAPHAGITASTSPAANLVTSGSGGVSVVVENGQLSPISALRELTRAGVPKRAPPSVPDHGPVSSPVSASASASASAEPLPTSGSPADLLAYHQLHAVRQEAIAAREAKRAQEALEHSEGLEAELAALRSELNVLRHRQRTKAAGASAASASPGGV